MKLLPKGTLRRAVFEGIDRRLAGVVFGQSPTLSTICGKRLFDLLKICYFCRGICWFANLLDKGSEDHCKKNKDKA
jgi:hypothetical protein